MNKYLNFLNLPQYKQGIERGVKNSCELCQIQFSLFQKQHICKRCLRSVCAQCSPFKVKSYLGNRNIRLHRMCNKCDIESNQIKKYISVYQIKWNQNSHPMVSWQKKCKLAQNHRSPKVSKYSRNFVSLQNLWMSFNYSFRQFISIVIQNGKVHDQQITFCINYGLEQLQNQGMELSKALYIYLFLVCHAKKQIALIYTKFLLKLFQIEKDKGTKQFTEMLSINGCSQIESFKINHFISTHRQLFLSSGTINLFPISVTTYIIDSFILESDDIKSFWKNIVKVLAMNKQYIIKKLDYPIKVFDHILKYSHIIVLGEQNSKISHHQKDKKSHSQISYKSYEKQESKNKQLQRQIDELKNKIKTYKNKINKVDLKHQNIQQHFEPNILLDDSYLNRTSTIDTNIDINFILQQKLNQIAQLNTNKIQIVKNYELKKGQLIESNINQQEIIKNQKNELRSKNNQLKQLQNQQALLKEKHQNLLKQMKILSNSLMDQQEIKLKESDTQINKYIQKFLNSIRNQKISQSQQ